MNPVVMRVTAKALVGGRRGVLLMILPAITLIVAVISRAASGADPSSTASTLNIVALSLVVPLTSLLVGTGVIGSEIEDGSIVYLLSKPIPRSVIAASKLVVGYAAAFVFAVVPTSLAALVGGDIDGSLAIALGVTSGLAVLAYVSIFFFVGIASRNAVVIGLAYALVWEGMVGSVVPGVSNVSVRQWSLAWGEHVAGSRGAMFGLTSDVGLPAATILIALTITGGAALSAWRLQRLQPRPSE